MPDSALNYSEATHPDSIFHSVLDKSGRITRLVRYQTKKGPLSCTRSWHVPVPVGNDLTQTSGILPGEIFTANASIFVSNKYYSVYTSMRMYFIEIQFYVHRTRFSYLNFLGIFLASLYLSLLLWKEKAATSIDAAKRFITRICCFNLIIVNRHCSTTKYISPVCLFFMLWL